MNVINPPWVVREGRLVLGAGDRGIRVDPIRGEPGWIGRWLGIVVQVGGREYLLNRNSALKRLGAGERELVGRLNQMAREAADRERFDGVFTELLQVGTHSVPSPANPLMSTWINRITHFVLSRAEQEPAGETIIWRPSFTRLAWTVCMDREGRWHVLFNRTRIMQNWRASGAYKRGCRGAMIGRQGEVVPTFCASSRQAGRKYSQLDCTVKEFLARQQRRLDLFAREVAFVNGIRSERVVKPIIDLGVYRSKSKQACRDGVGYVFKRRVVYPLFATDLKDALFGTSHLRLNRYQIAADLLEGLADFQREGKIHRDIKPGNVLLNHQGRAYYTDFGSGCEEGGSEIGELVGTERYAPPEMGIHDGRAFQKNPDYRATHKTDVYNVGLLFYMLVTDDEVSTRFNLNFFLTHRWERPSCLMELILAMLHPNPLLRVDAERAQRMFATVTRADFEAESELCRKMNFQRYSTQIGGGYV